jgi:hypothetical protein
MRSFLIVLAVVLIASALSTCSNDIERPRPEKATTSDRPVVSENPADNGPKVILLIIDGPRYVETFGDTAGGFANIPDLWNELRPQGTLLTNFRNQGQTKTMPGHSSMLSGTWQSIANDGTEPPHSPTLFEYYRKELGAPQSEVYLITGKAKLGTTAYSDHSEYGAAYGASVITGGNDLTVRDSLHAVLGREKPRLVMVSFSEVDWKGHSNVWADYIAAIANVDSLAAETWEILQSDPFYAGQTYMFITADHGRHTTAFNSHGDSCWGCVHLIFLALGPDVRAGYASDAIFTQRDICETVGEIFDIPVPYSEGNYLQDIFEMVPTGIK